jgi:hypothetical protein
MNINEIIKGLAAIERASKAYAKTGKVAISVVFGEVRWIGVDFNDAMKTGDYHFVSDNGAIKIVPAQITEIVTSKIDGKVHYRIVLNSKPEVDGKVENFVGASRERKRNRCKICGIPIKVGKSMCKGCQEKIKEATFVGAPAPDQLAKGIKVEEEHLETLKNLVRKARVKSSDQAQWDTDIIKDALEDIAQDHLKEIRNYYNRLAAMESKAKLGQGELDAKVEDMSAEIGCAVDYIEKQGRMQELIGEVSSPGKNKPCMAYIGSRVKTRTKREVSPADIAGYVLKNKVGQVSFEAEREEVGAPVKKPAVRTATISDRLMVFASSEKNDNRMAAPVQADALVNLFPYLEYRPYLKKDLAEMPVAKAAYISASVAESSGYDVREFTRAVFALFGYKDEIVGMEVVDLGDGNLITREEVKD